MPRAPLRLDLSPLFVSSRLSSLSGRERSATFPAGTPGYPRYHLTMRRGSVTGNQSSTLTRLILTANTPIASPRTRSSCQHYSRVTLSCTTRSRGNAYLSRQPFTRIPSRRREMRRERSDFERGNARNRRARGERNFKGTTVAPALGWHSAET